MAQPGAFGGLGAPCAWLHRLRQRLQPSQQGFGRNVLLVRPRHRAEQDADLVEVMHILGFFDVLCSR